MRAVLTRHTHAEEEERRQKTLWPVPEFGRVSLDSESRALRVTEGCRIQDIHTSRALSLPRSLSIFSLPPSPLLTDRVCERAPQRLGWVIVKKKKKKKMAARGARDKRRVAWSRGRGLRGGGGQKSAWHRSKVEDESRQEDREVGARAAVECEMRCYLQRVCVCVQS